MVPQVSIWDVVYALPSTTKAVPDGVLFTVMGAAVVKFAVTDDRALRVRLNGVVVHDTAPVKPVN